VTENFVSFLDSRYRPLTLYAHSCYCMQYKSIPFFPLEDVSIAFFIQVLCSCCDSLLVVETRNCCVCASASASVSQTISRRLSEAPCAVEVVHVRAQLQRSDGVSTVAYIAS